MSDERTRLEAIARDARNARQTIEALRDEEISAARRKIEEAYRERIADATASIMAAEQAVRAHIDASAGHPWEGKRVYRTEKILGEKRFEGIVEVRRTDTEMPGNVNYGLPKLRRSICSCSRQKRQAWQGSRLCQMALQFPRQLEAGRGRAAMKAQWRNHTAYCQRTHHFGPIVTLVDQAQEAGFTPLWKGVALLVPFALLIAGVQFL